ncbi:uncharacterized protein At2g39795, mitochondrial-like isoform X2 [Tasmannia lanceolata]|uniref:uncharacterized protein At2g39795, mitochondrial-like isoform X2 n=1 Tax=Tasmannia lanceolata TaxID=3420 RepID=UPI0040647ED7
MLGAISSVFHTPSLSSFASSRKPHYRSLIAFSSIGTKISQTPLEPSSLFPFNDYLSYFNLSKTKSRLDHLIDEKRLKTLPKPCLLLEEILRKYDIGWDEVFERETIQPNAFPFKFIDEFGKQSITLERDFKGESIQVDVQPLFLPKKEEVEKESWSQLNIYLVVKVSASQGSSLEFYCIASSTHIAVDKIEVNLSDVALILVGPKFVELDEQFQKDLNNYLEVRGIDSSLANFLQDYMILKDAKAYLAWLNGTQEYLISLNTWCTFFLMENSTAVALSKIKKLSSYGSTS